MAVDLNTLDPDFRSKMMTTYEQCRAAGFEFRPVFAVRSPWAQARLWRQSRSREEIDAALAKLRRGGATFLAAVLEGVGPQHGFWATNALPGMSWHNVKPAKALDSVLFWHGKYIWGPGDKALTVEERSHANAGYNEYCMQGEILGLTCLDEIHDIGHMQASAKELPRLYSLIELNDMMLQAWGPVEPR